MSKKHSLAPPVKPPSSPHITLSNHPSFKVLLTLKTHFRDSENNNNHPIVTTPTKQRKNSTGKSRTPEQKPTSRSTSFKSAERRARTTMKSPRKHSRSNITGSNSKTRSSPSQNRKSVTALKSQNSLNISSSRTTRRTVPQTSPRTSLSTRRESSGRKEPEPVNYMAKIASPRPKRGANTTRGTATKVKREEIEIESSPNSRSRSRETRLKKEHTSPRQSNRGRSPRNNKKTTPISISPDSDEEEVNRGYWPSPALRRIVNSNTLKSPRRSTRVAEKNKKKEKSAEKAQGGKRRRSGTQQQPVNLVSDENDFSEERPSARKGQTRKGRQSKVEIKNQKKTENKTKRMRNNLPRFPNRDEEIESLIVEAVNALKTDEIEKQIVEYFDRKFTDVDRRSIRSIMRHLEFDARDEHHKGIKLEDRNETMMKQEEPNNSRTLVFDRNTGISSGRKTRSGRNVTRSIEERTKIEEQARASTKLEEIDEEPVIRTRSRQAQILNENNEENNMTNRVSTRRKSRNDEDELNNQKLIDGLQKRSSQQTTSRSKPEEVPVKRGRGRPRKNGQQVTTSPAKKASASRSSAKKSRTPSKGSKSRSADKIKKQESDIGEKSPKRRGRKPKQPKPASTPYYELTDKGVKLINVETMQEEKKPGKRGRPPKQKKENVDLIIGSDEDLETKPQESQEIQEDKNMETEEELRKQRIELKNLADFLLGNSQESVKQSTINKASPMKSDRTLSKKSLSKASSILGTLDQPIEVLDQLTVERKPLGERKSTRASEKSSNFVLDSKEQSKNGGTLKKDKLIEIIDSPKKVQNPLESILQHLSMDTSESKKDKSVEDSPLITIHDFVHPREETKSNKSKDEAKITVEKFIQLSAGGETGTIERKRRNLLTESEGLKDKLKENIVKFFFEEEHGRGSKEVKPNTFAKPSRHHTVDKESLQSKSLIEIEELSFEKAKRRNQDSDLEDDQEEESEERSRSAKEHFKTPSQNRSLLKQNEFGNNPDYKTPEALFHNNEFSRPKPIDLPSANIDIDKLSLISPGRTVVGAESVPFLSAIQSARRDIAGSEARQKIDYEGLFVQKFSVFGNGEEKDKGEDQEKEVNKEDDVNDIQEPKPLKKRKLNEDQSLVEPEQTREDEGSEKMIVEEESLVEPVPETQNLNLDEKESQAME